MAKIPFETLKFVVAEDNAHMRQIVRTILRGFGCREIYEAEDGASGLEAVESFSPDILITDIKMPIFDGIELTRMIRNPEGCKHAYIPIIVLTAYSEKKHVVSARDAGATEFLRKPVSALSLHKRIHNVIVNPRPFIRTNSYFGPCRRRSSIPTYKGPERREKDETAHHVTPNSSELGSEPADTNQIDFDAIEVDDNQIDFDAIDADDNQVDFDAIDADDNQVDFDAIDADDNQVDFDAIEVDA